MFFLVIFTAHTSIYIQGGYLPEFLTPSPNYVGHNTNSPNPLSKSKNVISRKVMAPSKGGGWVGGLDLNNFYPMKS